jgi:hypothetical protein
MDDGVEADWPVHGPPAPRYAWNVPEVAPTSTGTSSNGPCSSSAHSPCPASANTSLMNPSSTNASSNKTSPDVGRHQDTRDGSDHGFALRLQMMEYEGAGHERPSSSVTSSTNVTPTISHRLPSLRECLFRYASAGGTKWSSDYAYALELQQREHKGRELNANGGTEHQPAGGYPARFNKG